MRAGWSLLLLVAVACDDAATSRSGLSAVPETERGARVDLVVDDRVVLEDVRDVAPGYVVDHAGVLWSLEEGSKKRVLDRVRRAPVLHPDGPIVVREGDEPGRSQLTILRAEPEVLAPSDVGADDLPLVLSDGRVVFVSTRTTIASVWVVDPKTNDARQITNVGLVAGRPLVGFVPPPAERFEYDDVVAWDAGGGERWTWDPATNEVKKP